MVDLKKLHEERERDLQDSLKIMDIMAQWIKSKPNKTWSRKQATLFASVYATINANWRKSGRPLGDTH